MAKISTPAIISDNPVRAEGRFKSPIFCRSPFPIADARSD
jgi:hypothetical protein